MSPRDVQALADAAGYEATWHGADSQRARTAFRALLAALQPERPLFIPLYRRYYEAFEAGTKTIEVRRYGPKWNEHTCRVGRPVTLSCGYGKHRRLPGVITAFSRDGAWARIAIAC
jgi:hypothetical protein